MKRFNSIPVGRKFTHEGKKFVKVDSTTARAIGTFHYIAWNIALLVEEE